MGAFVFKQIKNLLLCLVTKAFFQYPITYPCNPFVIAAPVTTSQGEIKANLCLEMMGSFTSSPGWEICAVSGLTYSSPKDHNTAFALFLPFSHYFHTICPTLPPSLNLWKVLKPGKGFWSRITTTENESFANPSVCHQSCLDTKLFSISMSLLLGAPVSRGCHWARCIFKELISASVWCLHGFQKTHGTEN